VRKILRPARIIPMIGLAGLMAAAPMMARGLAQFSVGMFAVPVSVQASVSGTARAGFSEPRETGRRLQLAEDVLSDRLDRVFHVAMEEDAAKVPAPHFADFDTRRIPVRTSDAKPLSDIDRFAMLPGDTAAVTLASLEERFAPMRMAEAADAAVDAAIALALATGEEEELAGESTEEAIASLESRLPEEVVVPIPRPAYSAKPKQASTALAYANPNAEIEEEETRDGIFGRLFGKRNDSLLPDRGSKVAVYDIGAQMVYMPNGEKLEAHSGLGHMKDNPRYVKEKNKGPTPPNLYNLRMREARFHGVEAIRLLPADGKKKFNRDGLLAHTYMYVAGGGKDKSQSNGCVVFKDYDKFLTAFKRGEVKHMIVVGHLKEVPTYLAAL
tara:strand:+ start:724 stop:1875 length:1152 start_codon:yes stop_codon:yes gene_type:complete